MLAARSELRVPVSQRVLSRAAAQPDVALTKRPSAPRHVRLRQAALQVNSTLDCDQHRVHSGNSHLLFTGR